MAETPQLEDKFIAFVDILGFNSKVESVEGPDGTSLSDLLEYCSILSQQNIMLDILEYGPTICPESEYKSRDLHYEVTQVSDCVVISTEVSPAGIINLLYHVSACVTKLMTEGMMARGYITRGNIYHQNNQFIGTGYQEALEKEKVVRAFRFDASKDSTPFVELNPIVVSYIKGKTDKCVQTMFSSMCTEDDHGIAAVFPFSRLSNLAGGNIMDAESCRKSLSVVRKWIYDFINKLESQSPSSDPKANKKSKYYRKFLYQQLDECDRIESLLPKMNQPAVILNHGSIYT